MVPNSTILSECKQRLNRVNSNYGEKIRIEEWDAYVNSAYRAWVKSRVKVADLNSKARTDLRGLEENDIPLNILTTKDQWVICGLPENHYSTIRLGCHGIRDGCKPRELTVHFLQGADWPETYRDPHWTPSFLWGRTLADDVGAGVKVGRTPDFGVAVTMDYYRVPAKVYSPEEQEIDYEGPLKVLGRRNIPFELGYMQFDEVADIAVYFATRDSGDPKEIETQWQKVVNLLNL